MSRPLKCTVMWLKEDLPKGWQPENVLNVESSKLCKIKGIINRWCVWVIHFDTPHSWTSGLVWTQDLWTLALSHHKRLYAAKNPHSASRLLGTVNFSALIVQHFVLLQKQNGLIVKNRFLIFSYHDPSANEFQVSKFLEWTVLEYLILKINLPVVD